MKSHPRNAYQRKDEVPVSPAVVREQCRPYRVLKASEPKFYPTIPANWPNQGEKFKPWTKDEESKVREALKSLPKKLTHVGAI